LYNNQPTTKWQQPGSAWPLQDKAVTDSQYMLWLANPS
jgi:hypothetical protein